MTTTINSNTLKDPSRHCAPPALTCSDLTRSTCSWSSDDQRPTCTTQSPRHVLASWKAESLRVDAPRILSDSTVSKPARSFSVASLDSYYGSVWFSEPEDSEDFSYTEHLQSGEYHVPNGYYQQVNEVADRRRRRRRRKSDLILSVSSSQSSLFSDRRASLMYVYHSRRHNRSIENFWVLTESMKSESKGGWSGDNNQQTLTSSLERQGGRRNVFVIDEEELSEKEEVETESTRSNKSANTLTAPRRKLFRGQGLKKTKQLGGKLLQLGGGIKVKPSS